MKKSWTLCHLFYIDFNRKSLIGIISRTTLFAHCNYVHVGIYTCIKTVKKNVSQTNY